MRSVCLSSVLLAVVACHAPPPQDASTRLIESQNAEFAAHADEAEHYAKLASSRPRMWLAAHRHAELALLYVNGSCTSQSPDYCRTQLTVANAARIATVQEILAHAVPNERFEVRWTIDGDRSCGSFVDLLRAHVPTSSPSALPATLTLTRCEVTSTSSPWAAQRCTVMGTNDGSSPCPPAQPLPGQEAALSAEVAGTPVRYECPCHVADATVGVVVQGSVVFAGKSHPFRHAWSKPSHVEHPDYGALPAWPTIAELVDQTVPSNNGYEPLAHATLAIAVLSAPDGDRDALFLECISRPGPNVGRPEPLELGLDAPAAARCATLGR